MNKKLLLQTLIVGAFTFAQIGCAYDKEGPAERAGKSVDRGVERAGDAIERGTDKMEDAGDRMRDSSYR